MVSPRTTLLARFALAPRTWNNEHTIGKLGLDARLYVPVEIPHGTTIAFRLVGETLFGTYPFFEAAALGGSPSLRGFERQRFTGDALLLTNIEIRIPVAKLFVLVPTTVGLSGFGETGRVFQKGEESGRWHPAGGAGVWASFVSRDATLSVSIARSAERTGVYITAGFMF